jgi:hypothetical protein
MVVPKYFNAAIFLKDLLAVNTLPQILVTRYEHRLSSL